MNPINDGLYTNRRMEIIEIGYVDRFNISSCIMHWCMLVSIFRFYIRSKRFKNIPVSVERSYTLVVRLMQ